jgi:alpha-tubulin suppressor-like RCC1 family protein
MKARCTTAFWEELVLQGQTQGQTVRWRKQAFRALVATWVALVVVGCAQLRPEASASESPSPRHEAASLQAKAGASHTLLLREDGTVWAWGANGSGQLGDGTTSHRQEPRRVAGLSAVKAVVASGEHSLALRGSDGSVWAWGQNDSGQLGDGSTVNRLLPVQVLGLEGVVALASGSDHVLALTSGRTVLAWGRNHEGQLGDGSTLPSSTPRLVSGLDDVVAVAAGGNHSLALLADGTVWAWGSNTHGQLGDGSKRHPKAPVQVAGLTQVVAVAAGDSHSLALLADGTVWAWGSNTHGQLGDGSTVAHARPARVARLTGVVALATGSHHTIALDQRGSVWTWGYNGSGQLGDGSTDTRDLPLRLSGLTGGASVDASGHHTVVVGTDGSVWTWGANAQGQLGDSSDAQSHTPVLVVRPALGLSRETTGEQPGLSSALAQVDRFLVEVAPDSASLLGVLLLGMACLWWARRPVQVERPARKVAHTPGVPATWEPAWVASLPALNPASAPLREGRPRRHPAASCSLARVLEDARRDVPHREPRHFPRHAQKPLPPQPARLPEVAPPMSEDAAASPPSEAPVHRARAPDKPVPRHPQGGPRVSQELDEHGRARERERRYREARPEAGAVRKAMPREVSGTRASTG